MEENIFGFGENLNYTYNYLNVLKESCEYSISFGLKYINEVKYGPEVYDVGMVEVDGFYFNGTKCLADIVYEDGTEFPTYKNRILPHQNKSRGGRSARMIDYQSTLHPGYLRGYNLTYPHGAFSGKPLYPVIIHETTMTGYFNIYHKNKFSLFQVLMIGLNDDDFLGNYSTDYTYNYYKDYITKNTNQENKVYVFDFMETKIPKIRMKNFFFPKGIYYNDSLTKADYLHHDFKSPAILTNNYFLYEVKNVYNDVYSKHNPGIGKESTQTLTGFYFVYYDYFGSPEPRGLNQFSYALENIFHYGNRTYVINKDVLMKSGNDNTKFFYKKGHPIMMYLHGFEGDKIQDDNLLFRNPAVLKKRDR